jgi:hypothetical protein
MTAKTGSSRSASPRLLAPFKAPMIFELTAKPIHPNVMAIPMALAVARGNVSPTTARVVGKTGAILSPVQNTATVIALCECSRSMMKVVMAISAAENRSPSFFSYTL